MSVSVEHPLHFSQQPQPPEPPFSSSPPHSPNHVLHAQPSTPTPMSTPAPATTTPPPDANMDARQPLGQGHDRDSTNLPAAPSNRDASTNTIAVQISALDEDAMDLTPEVEAEQLLLPDGDIQAQETLVVDMTTPSIDPPPPATMPPPANMSTQPPPPPPPAEPRSDSETSDDEDGLRPWHELDEDRTVPDEDELKEIEATPEHSALDHEYWESKAFLPLEDPEYRAGETGRIHWTIDGYNGTRQKPNHEIVMKSDTVTVGGHQWQIKFYPKGNDSDYLSVYLECLSVVDSKDKKDEDPRSDATECTVDDEGVGLVTEASNRTHNPISCARLKSQGTRSEEESTPAKAQHAPLPLLNSKKSLPKRNSIAAQVSVVLYNPTEPRVNYSRTALHRFCSSSPDWGWTRFHGPYYDISRRMRGQRMALLRDDKLAFTAYIRVVEDDTDCLWEHPSRENPWDSFAMTGLQGLMLGETASAPGGNMISAVASWMLFKPFRKLLYSIKVADPDEEPFTCPKPLVTAMQKVLFMLRTQVSPGAGAVTLDDVLDALEWYGIHENLDKMDVVEIWEVLRCRLEEELENTSHAARLGAIFGPKRNHATGIPSYRVPVVGVESMQEAINKSSNFTIPEQPLPELLMVELDRQYFDAKTHSYVKVLNKVTLDDRVTVAGTCYTLYGFVVHKQTLQSYIYQPILRPEGLGSRWYSYTDSKDGNQVRCITKRQAINAHEGKPGAERVIGNEAVAYIAMYVRDDASQLAFASDAKSEQWSVPGWIEAEVVKEKSLGLMPTVPPLPVPEPASGENNVQNVKVSTVPPKILEFQVIDSRVFLQHEGPGLFNAFHTKWEDAASELVHSVRLSSHDGPSEIREKIVSVIGGVKDTRQVKFWFLDTGRGSFDRPNLHGTGKVEFSAGSYDRYMDSKEWTLMESPFACRRLWVHVTDFDKLPQLPKEEEKAVPVPEMSGEWPTTFSGLELQTGMASGQVHAGLESSTPPTQVLLQSEDTPMSEPDESAAVQSEQSGRYIAETEVSPPTISAESADTAMIEVATAHVADPPAVDVVIPGIAPADIEMGGTQEDIRPPPPPPPPPVDLSMEPAAQPPPPARTPTPEPPPDEIYFFLKLWNPDKQTLEARGSYLALKSARVDETVMNLLGIPVEDKKKIEIWEEEELLTTRTIKHRRTFSQVDLHNTSIIIVAMPLSNEQRGALAARAAFADAQRFLKFCSFARNFPHKLNGHFTYDYFSGQYYKGEITNGYRHGHGTLIYHSGASYTGHFMLGQKHGHGLYTFQNGDTYDGDWVDDQQHGTGTFVEASSGNTYVGGWQNDKKFGEGVTHWKNAQESEKLCRICWDGEAEAAFYDCGHVVACLTCAREVQTCPVCRKRVLSSMKLYYVA